jgi:hypothetical protein
VLIEGFCCEQGIRAQHQAALTLGLSMADKAELARQSQSKV